MTHDLYEHGDECEVSNVTDERNLLPLKSIHSDLKKVF